MDIEKLLLKVLNDEASSQEYAALEMWKKESQENLKLLQELQTQHTDIQEGYKEYDKNAAWHKVETRILQVEQPARKLPAYLKWAGIAAVFFLGISTLFLLNQEPETPTEYNTTTETLQFALEDKTDIWLRDGGSKLEVISDFEKERRVALQGEAFFNVAHDTDRPFIIELAGQDYVRVVGTSFNLMNEGEKFDLTLFSGVVDLHMNGSTITLQKGDRAKKVDGSLVKYRNNDKNTASWKSKELVFENVNATEAFKALEDHFNISIDFSSATNNLSGCAIRSKFTNENVESVLTEFSNIWDFKYSNTNGKVVIKELSCN